MAVTTAVATAAVASSAYQIDQSNQAKREAGQTADAARIDAKAESDRQKREKDFNQNQAAMLAARNQPRTFGQAGVMNGTLLTSPTGLGSLPSVQGKTLLGQ